MKILQFIRVNIIYRIKQFGFVNAVRQLIRFFIRPIYIKNEDIVGAIIQRKPIPPELYSNVMPLTIELISANRTKWGIDDKMVSVWKELLESGCKGFVVEKDGKIAGYGFVQFTGIYRFGRTGKFMIPHSITVLKNLFVDYKYRGQGIGKQINAARIASIPENCIPIGFVIPENKYAIRNLKMYGFEEILKIKRSIWLGRWVREKIHIYCNNSLTNLIISGLT